MTGVLLGASTDRYRPAPLAKVGGKLAVLGVKMDG